MTNNDFQTRDDLIAAAKSLLIQAHQRTPSGRRFDRSMIARTERQLDWLRRTLGRSKDDTTTRGE